MHCISSLHAVDFTDASLVTLASHLQSLPPCSGVISVGRGDSLDLHHKQCQFSHRPLLVLLALGSAVHPTDAQNVNNNDGEEGVDNDNVVVKR